MTLVHTPGGIIMKEEERAREVLAEIAKAMRETVDRMCAPNLSQMQIGGEMGILAGHIIALEQATLAFAHPTSATAGSAAPSGMKPWHGGDCAPEDWDGSKVLLADGELLDEEGEDDPFDWSHHGGEGGCLEGWCIVAYTPKALAAPDDITCAGSEGSRRIPDALLDLTNAEDAQEAVTRMAQRHAAERKVALAERLQAFYDDLQRIYETCEDEGDRVYFASTNDHEHLRDIVREIQTLATAATLRPADARSEPVVDGAAEVRAALAVGERFLNSCFSAWSCGEPSHRVKTMLDRADEFRAALDALSDHVGRVETGKGEAEG